MHRYLLLLIYLICSNLSSAQGIKGSIHDLNTGEFLTGVSVKTNDQITYSDTRGVFFLSNSKSGDTIIFSYVGYQQQIYINNQRLGDTLIIAMKPSTIAIDAVIIKGLSNYKADSLRFRKEYADAFQYAKPKFKDIFIPKKFSSNDNRSPFYAPNSTSSLISVDVLSVISLLRKDKSPQAKLQKKLLKQEEQNYVDYAFSKQKIQQITQLTGDSLQLFIQEYRPDVDALKNMTTYDLMFYIKTKYQEFME